MNLSDKTAVIIGGGTGIGSSAAMLLAAEGCRVAIAGRRAEKLQEVAARCPAAAAGETHAIETHTVDIADRSSVAQLFDWAANTLGTIDILVNSAGVNVPKRSFRELAPADWDYIMQINATGAYNCMQAVLPMMRKAGTGLIVNICSVAGKRAGPLGGVAYNASKFAMSALGNTLAEEEKDHGIRVTTIYPGEVETPILDERPVPVSAEHRARILQPQDVAQAVLMTALLPPRARVAELVIIPATQAFQ